MEMSRALAQLVEHGDAALQQRSAVDGRIGGVTVALKQAHSEHMFEVCDRLRHHGFENGDMLSRFRHAFALHDRKQDMAVA